MSTYISISEMAKRTELPDRPLFIMIISIYLSRRRSIPTVTVIIVNTRYHIYARFVSLNSLGISLKDIQQHFQERTPENEMYLLEKQKQYIMNQIAKLNTLREYLNQRIDLYEEAVDAGMMRMSLPFDTLYRCTSGDF